MTNDTLRASRESLIADIDRRVEDHILEPTNAELLKKLIRQADDIDEAMMIAALGTTYKRTGFHFDKRLEKLGKDIRYFKKNEALSFRTDESRPTHKLIIGDNYEALQNLLIEYKNRVSVIYIDPPYGKDSMGEFAQTNYENAITRDNLLSMLYPRLMLAKQLLADDGVIFCSIDDKNQAYVKCLFDDVFGEWNFVANIVWQKIHSIKNDAKYLSDCHEYIIVYAKNIEHFTVNLLPRTEEMNARYTNPDNDERGPWQSGDLVANGERKNGHFVVRNPETGCEFDVPQGKHWVYSQENMQELIESKRLYFGVNGDAFPRKKRFLSEVQAGRTPSTLWLSEEVGHNQSATKEVISIFGERGMFDFPKPTRLMQQILQISSKQDAIILDFFAGSGTTGHAVLDLNEKDKGNRQFILCQLNEKTDTTPKGIAYDVTAKRLKRIMTGECYDGTKDFKWAQDNLPYGDNLDVYEIGTMANDSSVAGKTPFDVIDETLYGQEKFETLKDKIAWVCSNFAHTQQYLESDKEWETKRRELDHATRG
ncbi:MAG: site-specific DNA-methyltransferase [Prevotella sp.]|nr:site-specific DNA-methyltransferase [Prevotella sp.]